MKRKKIIITTILLVILISSYIGYRLYQKTNYLTYICKIEIKDQNKVFSMYKDDNFWSNPRFYVLKHNSNINPKKEKYKSVLNKRLSQDEYKTFYDRVILENIEEDLELAKKPSLILIENRYLVMERGGLYFALYDTQTSVAIHNNCCPWSEWASQNIWSEKGTEYNAEAVKNEKTDYRIWVTIYINDSITNVVNPDR